MYIKIRPSKRECTIRREIIKLYKEKKRVEWQLPGTEDAEMEYTGQRVQASSYKNNKFWGSNVQQVIIYQYLRVAKIVDLKCFQHKRKMVV